MPGNVLDLLADVACSYLGESGPSSVAATIASTTQSSRRFYNAAYLSSTTADPVFATDQGLDEEDLPRYAPAVATTSAVNIENYGLILTNSSSQVPDPLGATAGLVRHDSQNSSSIESDTAVPASTADRNKPHWVAGDTIGGINHPALSFAYLGRTSLIPANAKSTLPPPPPPAKSIGEMMALANGIIISPNETTSSLNNNSSRPLKPIARFIEKQSSAHNSTTDEKHSSRDAASKRFRDNTASSDSRSNLSPASSIVSTPSSIDTLRLSADGPSSEGSHVGGSGAGAGNKTTNTSTGMSSAAALLDALKYLPLHITSPLNGAAATAVAGTPLIISSPTTNAAATGLSSGLLSFSSHTATSRESASDDDEQHRPDGSCSSLRGRPRRSESKSARYAREHRLKMKQQREQMFRTRDRLRVEMVSMQKEIDELEKEKAVLIVQLKAMHEQASEALKSKSDSSAT